MLPASPMEWVDFNIFQVGFAFRSRRFDAAWKLPSGCMGSDEEFHVQRVHVCLWLLWQDISQDSWQGFMYTIWSFWMTLIWISDMATLFHQLHFFQKVYCKQNGKQTHPRQDILSPVDERSRQLTSNSSLMGLESQCANASKSTWHLFSPISLAFLQTCQVSNV